MKNVCVLIPRRPAVGAVEPLSRASEEIADRLSGTGPAEIVDRRGSAISTGLIGVGETILAVLRWIARILVATKDRVELAVVREGVHLAVLEGSVDRSPSLCSGIDVSLD